MTADGSTLLGSDVEQLVSAMAAFDPPPSGQLNLSSQVKEALTPVITANWQQAA